MDSPIFEVAIYSQNLDDFRQLLLNHPGSRFESMGTYTVLSHTIRAGWKLGVTTALEFGCRSIREAESSLLTVIKYENSNQPPARNLDFMIHTLQQLLANPYERSQLERVQDGMTPLSVAISLHRSALVPILLQVGSHQDPVSTERTTPLDIAVKTDQLDMVQVLAVKRPGMLKNYTQKSAFGIAIENGHFAIVDFLLDAYPKYLDSMEDGDRVLPFAVKYGTPEIVELLLTRGRPIDLIYRREEPSLIQLAMERNRLETVAVLIRHRVPEWDTSTVILGIIEAKSAPLLQLMIDQGTSHLDTIRHGLSLFHLAARNGGIEILRVLVATPKFWTKIPLEVMLRSGEFWHSNGNWDYRSPPIHLAVGHSQTEVIRYLSQLGSPVDLPLSNSRVTPLHLAAQRNDVASIQTLFECHLHQLRTMIHRWQGGAITKSSIKSFLDPKTDYHQTPFGLAVNGGNIEAATWLIRYGSQDSETRIVSWPSTMMSFLQAIGSGKIYCNLSEEEILGWRYSIYFEYSLTSFLLPWC